MKLKTKIETRTVVDKLVCIGSATLYHTTKISETVEVWRKIDRVLDILEAVESDTVYGFKVDFEDPMMAKVFVQDKITTDRPQGPSGQPYGNRIGPNFKKFKAAVKRAEKELNG